MERVKIVKIIKSLSLVFCALFIFGAAIFFYLLWTKGYNQEVAGSLLASSFLGVYCYLLSCLANRALNKLLEKTTGKF